MKQILVLFASLCVALAAAIPVESTARSLRDFPAAAEFREPKELKADARNVRQHVEITVSDGSLEKRAIRHVKKNGLQKAGQLLRNYAERLKSYFVQACFDDAKFNAQVSKLRREFMDIGSLMNQLSAPTKELINQYKFTRDMYQTLLTLNEFRKKANQQPTLMDHLLRDIKELHSRIFRLFDSEGNPDSEVEGYEQTVLTLGRQWARLQEEKEKLGESPSILQFLLDMDFQKVKHSLMVLEDSVSDEDTEDYAWPLL